MADPSQPDLRITQIRELLLPLFSRRRRAEPPSVPQLTADGGSVSIPPSSDAGAPSAPGSVSVPPSDPLDEVLARTKLLVDEVTALRAAAVETDRRIHELMDMVVAMVSFDYKKKAQVSDKDDVFDGFASGLNMLSEELASSTDYMSNVIEAMTDLLVVVDEDGTIKSVNRAACELLRYTKDELLNRPIGLIFAGVSARQLAERGGVSQQETTCRTKERESIPVSFSASIMRDYHGKIQGIVCVARDLTENRRIEDERLRLRDAVQRQAIIVEELSTPLIPISEDILVMPLIGSLDADRSQRMTVALLEGIVSRRARIAILDITGVRAIDQQAVQGIIQAVQAARLIGAKIMLTGIRPDVAVMLVDLNADLTGIFTFGTLQSAVVDAMKRASSAAALRGGIDPRP
jgi:rsbT co-antagonist protein RsbR